VNDLKDFIEYIKKNKYVIICVTIVVILYAVGIVELLTKIIILFALIGLAIFVGKKLQDNENFLKDILNKFNNKDMGNVYYYQNKDEDKK
jgi:uncharacterized membrane protein